MSSVLLMKLKLIKNLMPLIIIMSVMATAFIYIFGYSFGESYIPTAYIIDEDYSMASGWLIESLSESDSFNMEVLDYNQAIEGLEDGVAIGGIKIEAGFEEGLNQGEVKVLFYQNSSAIELMTLENILKSVISELKANYSFSQKMSDELSNDDYSISEEVVYEKIVEEKRMFPVIDVEGVNHRSNVEGYNAQKHYFSGFLIFFSLFTIMFGIGTIVEEKELMVYNRQLVSPLTPFEIITGNLIGNFILGIGQLSLIIVITKVIFGMDWGGSTLALLIVLAMFSVAGTAIGLFITGLVKTQQQLSAVLPTFIVATSMLGGCMWPIEIIDSKVLLFIANLTPQRWALRGISQVIVYNGGLQDIIMPIAILMIISVIFMVLSVYLYKKSSIR